MKIKKIKEDRKENDNKEDKIIQTRERKLKKLVHVNSSCVKIQENQKLNLRLPINNTIKHKPKQRLQTLLYIVQNHFRDKQYNHHQP